MIFRKAVRAVMLTPERQVLLLLFQEPSSGRRLWVTPGGGIEKGEAPVSSLQREIKEETGLAEAEIGPLIWRRCHTFEWDDRMYTQDEDLYLVQTKPFEPCMRSNPSETESSAFREFKWWTHQEMVDSQDVLVPRTFAEHLRNLILDGPPAQPIEVGV